MSEALLDDVVAFLERRGSSTALIGAIALAAHGIARATLDLDLLALDSGLLRQDAWAELEAKGVTVEVRRGTHDDPLAGVVRAKRGEETPVDVVVGKHRFLEDVLSRRRTILVGGRSLPFVDAADLVVLKVFAGGPQDLLDAELLLAGAEGGAIRSAVEARLASLPRALREDAARLLARTAR